jgi:hypothetical protein
MVDLMKFGSVPLGEGLQAGESVCQLVCNVQCLSYLSRQPTLGPLIWLFPSLTVTSAGEHFGLFVTSPFTQPAVIQAAMQFNKADCVQPQPSSGGLGSGLVAGGTAPLLGKMPLRLAFPEVPTCWRGKDPIEVRSAREGRRGML